MQILYFYQYFSTPKGSWGTRVYEFATEWIKAGHQVTVVSAVYSKSDLKATRLLETQHIDGIDVKVINVLIDNKQQFIKRLYTFLVYAVISSWYALRLPCDIVIASSGPITVGMPGLLARFIRGKKLIFETRDLWPDGAIELGLLRNKWLQKSAYWFEKQCYTASSLVVALSPGMRTQIQNRFPQTTVISITNSANIALFSTPRPFEGREILTQKRYAIYTGNIGMVNNVMWMLEAAKILKDLGRADINIVLIGDGQQKHQIKVAARDYGLDNMIIWDLMPKIDLVPLVQHAMVSLVPLKDTPVLDTSSPNKFFESLAAGVPLIQNTNGWMKDFLEEHNVGFTIDPNNPEALAWCLIRLHAQPELLEEMGNRAKLLAAQLFDKRFLASEMLEAIKKVVY